MERTGALKIYFGYAEGVGKTQAMLQEARDAKTRGKDVAAGCIEIRRHEGTQELLQGLEVIGSMKMAGQEPDGGDLDLDQILERRPQIFLVDDLAHVNAEGSRHARRYQDVKELLTAGIEVWTTLNVQELESLNDVVVSIAGRETTERIPDEAEVAEWVYRNNRHAGATTDTWSHAKCLYLAIRVNAHVYGVVGITVGEEELDSFEHSVLLSNLGECALALENDQNAREKEEAAVMAKNEQLRANILRAISHDLRTPLTSISGNASNLVSNSESFTEEMKQAIYKDIYEDSMWLI